MRFKVHVKRTSFYNVEVEADSVGQAESFAQTAAIPSSVKLSVTSDAFVQLGEPWLYGSSGALASVDNTHRFRPDGYLDTKDLLVFERALGNRFTRNDVDLLKARAEASIGPVAEHWNGEGYNALSIRMAVPFGQLTDEQVARIMAPRD